MGIGIESRSRMLATSELELGKVHKKSKSNGNEVNKSKSKSNAHSIQKSKSKSKSIGIRLLAVPGQ